MPYISSRRKKVIVQIKGGLGNQLFQYAAARRFAINNNVPLVLDHISVFKNDYFKRNFLLDRFKVQCGYIKSGSSYTIFIRQLGRLIQKFIDRYRDLQHKTHIVEKDSSKVDPMMLNLQISGSVYMEGYWQHEEYFLDIRDQLCDELTLHTPHDKINLDCAKRIEACESVCLHVRRLHGVPQSADAKPMANQSEEHIDPDYYSKAVEILAQKVKSPHFFVFSDYPDWAKENIHVPYPIEYITHNGQDDCEDFWLMGQCKHFIVANSTFSWWAAWLGKNENKVVIAPKSSIGFRLQSTPPSWLLI